MSMTVYFNQRKEKDAKSGVLSATTRECHIMIPIMLFIGLSLTLSVSSALADTSPMVEKHIFMPENLGEPKEEVRAAPGLISGALEKDLLFTGVVILPEGRYVMITESGQKSMSKGKDKDRGKDKGKDRGKVTGKTDIKHMLKEGDQIKGMVIQEIGSNFVLLAGKENETVRMNLYKGAKVRPAPAPAETRPESAAGVNEPQAAPAAPETVKIPDGQSPPAAEKEQQGPSAGDSNGKRAPNTNGEPRSNPFLDMFNKSLQDRKPNALQGNPFNNLPMSQ